jgi:hypothetical protein
VKGLSLVDTSAKRLVAGVDRLVDFSFPDPYLLLSSGDKILDQIVHYLGFWSEWRAIVVDKLEGNISSSSRIGLTTQQWRACLTPSSAQSQSERLTRTQQRKTAAVNGLASQLARANLPDRVFWNKKEILSSNPASARSVAPEVIWNLYEQNFRIEMLLLDRAVMSASWENPALANRQEGMLRRIFPGDTGFFVGEMPHTNQGLAAESWAHRGLYVQKFCELLADWPKHPAVFDQMPELSNEKRMAEMEHMAIAFYCQTFFDYFARAPITPHRLPSVL